MIYSLIHKNINRGIHYYCLEMSGGQGKHTGTHIWVLGHFSWVRWGTKQCIWAQSQRISLNSFLFLSCQLSLCMASFSKCTLFVHLIFYLNILIEVSWSHLSLLWLMSGRCQSAAHLAKDPGTNSLYNAAFFSVWEKGSIQSNENRQANIRRVIKH